MKFLIVLALAGIATAQFGGRPAYRPAPSAAYRSGGDVQIIKSELQNDGDGSYSYAYETSDGTSAAQRGSLKAPNQDNPEGIQVSEGFYQFVSPEGGNFRLDYLADENGYQPRADHLPTPPPIPEEIQRALEILYRNAGDQRQSASFQSSQQQSYRPAAARPFRRF